MLFSADTDTEQSGRNSDRMFRLAQNVLLTSLIHNVQQSNSYRKQNEAFQAATTTAQCIQGTKELVVERRQNVLRVVGSMGIPAGWRARHLGWVSYLAQDGATLCIEPRGKLGPMCMRMYVK